MKRLSIVFTAGLMLMAIGCSGNKVDPTRSIAEPGIDGSYRVSDQKDGVTQGEIFGDMSPELVGLGTTVGQGHIRNRKAIDTNGRSAWDDLADFLFYDRPLRISAQMYTVPD